MIVYACNFSVGTGQCPPAKIVQQFWISPREITWIACGDVILFQNHREGHCPSPTMDVWQTIIYIANE